MQTFEQTCSISNNSFEFCLRAQYLRYRKIPKISPRAYIFLRAFLRGLFLEGLIFGGAYLRREICVSKSIGLACSGKEIYHFCFVLLCIRGQIPSTSPPGGLYLEGRFNGGFFALPVWGAYIWRGLYMEGLIFGILRYSTSTLWPLFTYVLLHYEVALLLSHSITTNKFHNVVQTIHAHDSLRQSKQKHITELINFTTSFPSTIEILACSLSQFNPSIPRALKQNG